MHSARVAVLLVGAAAAQSSVVILNPFDDKTLTFKGSDATATTYEHVCPATSSGSLPQQTSFVTVHSLGDSSASTSSSQGDVTLAPFPNPTESFIHFSAGTFVTFAAPPLPTPKARLRRRSSDDDESSCEPYTLIQGSETWEFHMTDPVPGSLTTDASCNWKGELTSATVTCNITANGSDFAQPSITSNIANPSDLSSQSAIQTLAVVSAATTNGNISGTGSHSPSATGPTSGSRSPTSISAQSTGLAPPLALPTGAMAFVGGAVGLFAAALAL